MRAPSRGCLDFPTEWARCAPWIEKALAYAEGTHDLEDVRQAIETGQAQFWPGERSAVVTEINRFPKLTSLHFWLCGGDLSELINDMRPAIEAFGREVGCTRFTTAGREGWQRVMARHGYRPQWHVCMKDTPR